MGKLEPLYQRAVAQDILEVAVGDMGLIEFGIVRIDDRGVWIDQGLHGAWHPAMEIDEPGSPDARSDPNLPFPFTAKQLAAFALSDMGHFVANCFFGDGPFFYAGEGPWGDSEEQRDEMLSRLPKLANKAREAVLKTREAYDAAAAGVLPPSVGTNTEGGHDKEQLERELERWRREMCRALLRPAAGDSRLNVDLGALVLPVQPTDRLLRDKSALSANARKGALARHSPDNPKNKTAQAKAAVFACWTAWKSRPSNYKSTAAFARDMLDKHPDVLTSQDVVERWARTWRQGK